MLLAPVKGFKMKKAATWRFTEVECGAHVPGETEPEDEHHHEH